MSYGRGTAGGRKETNGLFSAIARTVVVVDDTEAAPTFYRDLPRRAGPHGALRR
ncbi:hypothetical protein ACWC5I_42560 [Kitasatospora sp. NPDC001574]